MEPQSNLTIMNINPAHFQHEDDQPPLYLRCYGPITGFVLQVNEETGEIRWVQL